jgi:hypothetical protein
MLLCCVGLLLRDCKELWRDCNRLACVTALACADSGGSAGVAAATAVPVPVPVALGEKRSFSGTEAETEVETDATNMESVIYQDVVLG